METNDYQQELSSSWTLIDFNQTEEPLLYLETSSEISPAEFLSLKPGNEISKENLKFTKNIQKVEKDYKDTLQSVNLGTCEELASAVSEANLKVQDQNSDDSDSIEIIDSHEDYEDIDLDEHISFHYDIKKNDWSLNCLNPDILQYTRDLKKSNHVQTKTNIRKRCKKLTHVFSLSSTYPSVCELSEFQDISKPVGDLDLKLDICKAKSLPFNWQHIDKFKNITISLLLCVLFAGVVCLVIGQILGVQNLSEDLVKTLESLKLENAALQSQLSEINTAFAKKINYFHSKQYMPKEIENNSKHFSLNFQNSKFENLISLQNSRNKNLKQNQKRKMSKGKINVDLSRALEYIQLQIKALNINYKELSLKHLEESTDKIRDIFQAILKLLATPKRMNNLYYKMNNVLFPNKQSKHTGKELTPKYYNHSFSGEAEINLLKPLCLFPQPKEYYKIKKRHFNIESKNSGVSLKVNLNECTNIQPLKIINEKENKKVNTKANIIRNNANINIDINKKGKFKYLRREKKKQMKANHSDKFFIKKKNKLKNKIKGVSNWESSKKSETTYKKIKKFKYRKSYNNENASWGKSKNEKKTNKKQSSEKHSNRNKDNFFMWTETDETNHRNKIKKQYATQYKRPEALKHEPLHLSRVSKNGEWIFEWADAREELRKKNQENWQFRRANGRKQLRDESSK